jgi:hypothetical protein
MALHLLQFYIWISSRKCDDGGGAQEDRMRIVLALALAAMAACSPITEQTTLYKPPVAGKPYAAGAGDTVMDIRQTQSLPNAAGKADAFGRTRDSGRIMVRYLGMDGNRAFFARQDVAIQSNETTMSRTPMVIPTFSTTSGNGYIGSVPISGSSNTSGLAILPPSGANSFPMQAGQIQLSAPIGGSVLVEGRRLNVLRPIDGGIEYSVD